MLKQENIFQKLIPLFISKIEIYFYHREMNYSLKKYNEVNFLYVNWVVIKCTAIEKEINLSEITN